MRGGHRGGRLPASVSCQLRLRGAMGGEPECAELAACEALLVKSIADAVVRQLREGAAADGVDVWTWEDTATRQPRWC